MYNSSGKRSRLSLVLLVLVARLLSIKTFGLANLIEIKLLSQSINVSYPPPRNWPSDAWRPAIFTSCFPGLHNDSAPCRGIPNLIYAEELVYPDFRIKLPRFIVPEHKGYFLTIMQNYHRYWLRARIIDNHAYFLNQRGQNLIYANVTYTGQPAPGRWADNACATGGAHTNVRSFPPWDGGQDAPAVVFSSSPDDHSFQHFGDRVAMMLAQIRHIGDLAAWQYISIGRANPMIHELWSMLIPGFKQDQFVLAAHQRELHTRLFMYPCQTPLIHPYTHQLTNELYQQAAGFDPAEVEPISARPVVLFMERKGSRAWANEDECRKAVEDLLAVRGKGEELKIFRATDYPTYKDVIRLGRRVKMLVGAHGGAMSNVHFMLPGTSIVEVCPVAPDHQSSRCGAMIWELASVRRMPFWSVLADNTNGHWAINHLDCSLVTRAVQAALEEMDVHGLAELSPVEQYYQGTSLSR